MVPLKDPTPDIRKEASLSAASFHQSLSQTMHLFYFIIHVVLHQDYVAHIASAALKNQPTNPDITPHALAEQTPGEATKTLRRFRQPLLEMILCRLVDNFTAYLADIIREVLQSRPEVMRSAEQVRLDHVLSYRSIEDFTRDLIERKITELSYLGFNQLIDWFSKRLGLDLTQDERMKAVIVEALETRNAIVHNRTIVGPNYLRKVQNPQFEMGDLRKLDVDYVCTVMTTLLSFVNCTDDLAAAKFALSREPMAPVNEAQKYTKEG